MAYPVLWMRRLAPVFGDTALASGTVLAVFLCGVAIGSWVWGRVADRRPQSTLITLAAIEIATGLYGFASLWLFGGIEWMYLAAYPSLGDSTTLLASMRFLLSTLAILPPALPIGGFLPLLARRMASSSGSARSTGAVYGWNTLGAAACAAAMTYGLLPAVGVASFVALVATLNILVGAAAFAMDRWIERETRQRTAGGSMPSGVMEDSSDPGVALLILSAFAASGFALAALGLGWARLLAMIMGTSVYAYGTLATIVLFGLGIGGALYGRAERTIEGHQRRFAAIECLIAFTAALSMAILPRIPALFVRFLPLFRSTFGRQTAAQFAAATAVALLPSLLFGAAFPAAIGSLGGSPVRLGRTIGAAYAANAMGIVIGAFLVEFAVFHVMGLRAAMTFGVLATASAGGTVWWLGGAPRRSHLKALAPALASLLVIGILFAWPRAWPREVFAAGVGSSALDYGNDDTLKDIVSGVKLLYYRDGAASTISVDDSAGTLTYRSNGEANGSSDPADMAGELLLGHLPMLLHPAPRGVFVLGLGTGVTAAAVARYPVQQIDIAEPEPAAAGAARLFEAYNRKVLDDPRVRLIAADGRNRLLGMPRQYDVVISAESGVWVSRGASLYTLGCYRAVAARLAPGGVFAQWMDTHTLLPGDLDLLAATFHAVFPHMQIWTSGPGHLIFLGTRDDVAWDYTRLKRHFDQTEGVASDLQSAGIWRPFALFGTEFLGESESAALTRNAGELLTDDRPVLEFRTPRSLYVDTAPVIVNELNRVVQTGAPAIAGFDPEHDLDAETSYLLGFAYAFVGRPEVAVPYMEHSTKLDPKNSLFFVGLGNQYRAAGRDADAGQAYERALSLDLNNVEALVSLGEMRFEQGQLDWTRVLAARALRLAPQDPRVHALVGKVEHASR